MNSWTFVFSRRWLGYLAAAVVFALACAGLASWQLSRGRDAAAANAILDANFSASPVPLAEALPTRSAFRADQQWLQVTVSGRYLPDQELLVRNRPTDNGPGFEVLTPLQLADGSLFLVDRGWVPTGSKQDAPDSVPAPPAGEVHVVARLRPSEPRVAGKNATGHQISTIELDEVQRRIGGAVYTGAYGLLERQSPAGAAGLTPVVTTRPTQDAGLHWSYMIQWVIFALIGFFGLGYAVRQEYRNRNEDDPAEQERAASRERRKALKKSDAQIEDELLDSAQR